MYTMGGTGGHVWPRDAYKILRNQRWKVSTPAASVFDILSSRVVAELFPLRFPRFNDPLRQMFSPGNIIIGEAAPTKVQ